MQHRAMVQCMDNWYHSQINMRPICPNLSNDVSVTTMLHIIGVSQFLGYCILEEVSTSFQLRRQSRCTEVASVAQLLGSWRLPCYALGFRSVWALLVSGEHLFIDDSMWDDSAFQ